MARDRFGVANSFTNSFMRGFSFVDDIQRRNRNERRLEEELSRRHRREDRRDAIMEEDRNLRLEDRTRALDMQNRIAEATRLLSDPNVSGAELEPFSDIPAVSAFLAGRISDAEAMEDLRLITEGEDLSVSQPAAAASPGGLAAQSQAAATPGTGSLPDAPTDAPGMSGDLTQREINELSLRDPAAATAVRDQQNTHQEQKRANAALNAADPLSIGGPGASPVPTDLERARANAENQRSENERMWRVFADANIPEGDQMRNLPSETLVGQYHSGRSSVNDQETLKLADERMKPHISATIASQHQLLANPELNPDGLEARNAQRKLTQAYELANELGVTHKPLQNSGVDARGLPLNDANPTLTSSVVNGVRSAPGMAQPPSANQQRADVTMVNRGVRGKRVSERFAQAAFRLYKNGRLNFTQYESLMRTGKLPAAQPKIEQWDPEKDKVAIYPNGTVKVLQWGRVKPGDAAAAGRNLLSDEGLGLVNRLANAYNTSDDETRGEAMALQFRNFIGRNEERLTSHGYRFQNSNDVADAFTRWTQLAGVRDAYNDEWFGNGMAINPDFTEDFGTIDQAFFDPRIEGLIESMNLRVPGTTTFGLFGEKPELQSIRPRDPRVLRAVQQQHPDVFGDMSLEEVNAWLDQNRL